MTQYAICDVCKKEVVGDKEDALIHWKDLNPKLKQSFKFCPFCGNKIDAWIIG